MVIRRLVIAMMCFGGTWSVTLENPSGLVTMNVMDLTQAAVLLGRAGGSARTGRKQSAARSNGRLGGRLQKAVLENARRCVTLLL